MADTEVLVLKKAGERPNNSVRPQVYEVRKGDSLFKLARRFYGDESRLSDIREANGETIAAHRAGPNAIREGDVLRLPE